MIDTRSFKVYSSKDTDSEAGFAPFLEGVFASKEEAEAYANTWNSLYDFTLFWVA